MAEVAAQRAVGGVPAGGGEQANLAAAAAMRGRARGEVDTSSPFQSVRQAVDLFGGGSAAVSQWRHPQAPPPIHLRPEVSQPEPAPSRPGYLLLAALVYAKRGSGLSLFQCGGMLAIAPLSQLVAFSKRLGIS
jgi:hypothetical protein